MNDPMIDMVAESEAGLRKAAKLMEQASGLLYAALAEDLSAEVETIIKVAKARADRLEGVLRKMEDA